MSSIKSTAPTLSVVIGTLNRCDSLPKAIDSLLAQQCPPERLEIIVVDNGSTDATAQVAQGYAARDPRVRHVVEPKLGLSNARNKGISEARGAYVGFFDDDATAEPQWAATILSIIDSDPGVGALGGPIVVEWPSGRPSWMPDNRLGYYGHCYYGPVRRELTFPDYPYGSNMIISRERLQRIGGLRDKVGPKGKNMMSAGEQDLFQRLTREPLKIVYDPQAIVHHWISANQVTHKWLMRRALKHGMSNTRMMAIVHPKAPGFWLHQSLVAAGRFLVSALSGSTAWLTRRPAIVSTSRFANMMYWLGITRGSFKNVFVNQS